MSRKLFALFLISCTTCLGQAVLTTPGRLNPVEPCLASDPAAARDRSSCNQITAPSNSAPSGSEQDATNRGALRSTEHPQQKTEFEIYVEDTTGQRIQLYGRGLFEQVPTTFAPVDRIPVPDDYVIGAGDELLVKVWGKIELDSRVTVDRNGQIYLPRVGNVTVAGSLYSHLESRLYSAIGVNYKDFELSVTLGKLRSIQIYVLGSAERPGTYTISSLGTLVNALFASGGPSKTGSMRRIELIRNNQAIATFDLYDLVRRGDKSHDRQLLAGDIVFIPPAGATVAIVGSVQEPAIYELKGDESIASGLQDAGGITSLAELDHVSLERVEDHSRRRIEQLKLDASGLQETLRNGDLLKIFSISSRIENAVTLHGNVAEPGRYAWHPGMRVSDLIPSRDSLLTREYWNRENHIVAPGGKHQFGAESAEAKPIDNRKSDDHPDETDIRLSTMDNDSNQAPQTKAFQSVEHRGSAEENNNDDPKTANSNLAQPTEILRSHSEVNWRYASIERLDEKDLSPRLISFNLGNALDDHSSADNQLLNPSDVVTVFSRSDIPLPIEEHATFVSIAGEVNAPGVYRVSPGESLRNAVTQAGGLTQHSYLYASQLLRLSTRRIEEEQLKRSTEQMQRELAATFANASGPAAVGGADQHTQLSMQQELIGRISSIVPSGRVVLEMKADADTLADIPDFTLEDGDTFYIPPKLSTVQVSGAVYNENAFRYERNKLTTAYLEDAGGATRDADVSRMFLVRADGTVVSRQSHGHHQRTSFAKTMLLPGDAIVIPIRMSAGMGWKHLEEITGILSQSALTAASLAVIQK